MLGTIMQRLRRRRRQLPCRCLPRKRLFLETLEDRDPLAALVQPGRGSPGQQDCAYRPMVCLVVAAVRFRLPTGT
jgi:hypothetical protein